MASDRLVTPKHILNAVMEHERRGSTRLLSDLEKMEPDLAEYALENLSALYHQLTDLGLAGRDARKAYRSAEKTIIVCLNALRAAHRDLWDVGDDSPVTPQ